MAWTVDLITLRWISKANLRLDQLENFVGGGTGIELDGVELTIHEMEASIDGSSVDSTQDFLFWGRPLSSTRSQRLVKTLQEKFNVDFATWSSNFESSS